MTKYWLVAVILALVLVGVGLTGCSSGSAGGLPSAIDVRLDGKQEGISVSGHGKVAAASDVAILRLGVSAQATSVAEAQSRAANAMDKVMNALSSNGVAKKDIQTRSFSIQQVTRWDKNREQELVIGYRVANMVIAKIRTLDKTGAVVDAVATAGGDLTRVDNISFSIDDPAQYYREAREKAMNDAKAKAEQIAKLAGVTLGKPIYISESTRYMPPAPMPMPAIREAAGAAPTTPISAGELDITLDVQVNYSIR